MNNMTGLSHIQEKSRRTYENATGKPLSEPEAVYFDEIIFAAIKDFQEQTRVEEDNDMEDEDGVPLYSVLGYNEAIYKKLSKEEEYLKT